MRKDVSTYAVVYPNQITEFLKKQQDSFNKDNPNVEVAFVGRSNVGKSSLVNKILEQEHAKVSKIPGKTNFLQFIYLPIIGITLVDCPGYGFAKRSLKEKNDWHKMMHEYFHHSPL